MNYITNIVKSYTGNVILFDKLEKSKNIIILDKLIIDENTRFGDLKNIIGSVKCIGNMSYMFENSLFNGDISSWDVSSVTAM